MKTFCCGNVATNELRDGSVPLSQTADIPPPVEFQPAKGAVYIRSTTHKSLHAYKLSVDAFACTSQDGRSRLRPSQIGHVRTRSSVNVLQRAFTLVEILIVIGVVAALAAVAIPAILYARSATNRIYCQMNMRQIGVAFTSYHSITGSLPCGRISRYSSPHELYKKFFAGGLIFPWNATPEIPWTVQLLPYIGQVDLADKFDSKQGVLGYLSFQPPYLFSGINQNHLLAMARPSVLVCPADRHKEFDAKLTSIFGFSSFSQETVRLRVSKGNYAVAWGNTTWNQDDDVSASPPSVSVHYARSAFGNKTVCFREITKGLSKAILLSEVLQGKSEDIRGVLWLAIPGATLYMSRLPPNGSDDQLSLAIGTGDLLPNGMCIHEKALPCHTTSTNQMWKTFAGARSRHPGGVNVLWADGAVSFVGEDIDPAVWENAHGIEANQ
ncbi:DUF1559 domain-containing protein [bacterium]|nr:DUF1559 domain-containing protein [bacterium]